MSKGMKRRSKEGRKVQGKEDPREGREGPREERKGVIGVYQTLLQVTD